MAVAFHSLPNFFSNTSRKVNVPVEVEILNYLARHPDAKDTPEGIAEWWIPRRGPRPTVTEINAALENLRARGLIVAEQGGDGRMFYRGSNAQRRETKNKSGMNGN